MPRKSHATELSREKLHDYRAPIDRALPIYAGTA